MSEFVTDRYGQRVQVPVYGYVCLSCGGSWRDYIGKHSDETGFKCRDLTGSANPSAMGPVATEPWGPEGIKAEVRWENEYLDDQIAIARGYGPPSPREEENEETQV